MKVYDSRYDYYDGEMDQFVCDKTIEEMYAYDYAMHDTWADVEWAYCEELGLEPTVYED